MKNYILPLLLAGILFFIFFYKADSSYRMPPMYNYDSDFGRDLYMMERISRGKLTLVGPQFSFSGLRLAPYHFYVFAPFLKLGGSDYRFVIYSNAAFFLIGFLLFFLFLKKRTNNIFAFLSTIWVSTTPFFILSGRSPGNAFSYLILLIGYLACLFYINKTSFLKSIVLGLIAGVIINYHPISFLSVILPFFIFIFLLKNYSLRQKLLQTAIFLCSLSATFAPVVLFDMRHGFVILKSVFSGRSAEYLGSQGLIGGLSLSNLTALSQTSLPFIHLGIIGLFLLVTVVFMLQMKNRRIVFQYAAVFLIFIFLLLFGKNVPHYMFPLLVLLQLTLMVFISKSRGSIFLLLILIFINVLFFPRRFYASARNLGQIENNFQKVIAGKILPKNRLNIYLLNETYLSAPGYEYRFLLAKYGYNVDDEHEYKNSNYLLLISEKGDVDWSHLKSWELDEFGQKNLINKFKEKNITYYLFEKGLAKIPTNY